MSIRIGRRTFVQRDEAELLDTQVLRQAAVESDVHHARKALFSLTHVGNW